MLDTAEAMPPPPQGDILSPGFMEAAAIAAAEATAATEEETAPTLPPLAVSTPGSPDMMREAGDIVAALAVSEILSAESHWPLTSTQTPPLPPALTCGDSSYDEPLPVPFSADLRSDARKLGALAFPPHNGKEGTRTDCKFASGSSGELPPVDEDAQSEADILDELMEPLVCWSRSLASRKWARPLALVAALLASHAACILIGVAIGKAQSREVQAPAAEGAFLTRRFSSSSMPTTRMCTA